MAAITALLKLMDITGSMITIDAIGTIKLISEPVKK